MSLRIENKNGSFPLITYSDNSFFFMKVVRQVYSYTSIALGYVFNFFYYRKLTIPEAYIQSLRGKISYIRISTENAAYIFSGLQEKDQKTILQMAAKASNIFSKTLYCFRHPISPWWQKGLLNISTQPILLQNCLIKYYEDKLAKYEQYQQLESKEYFKPEIVRNKLQKNKKAASWEMFWEKRNPEFDPLNSATPFLSIQEKKVKRRLFFAQSRGRFQEKQSDFSEGYFYFERKKASFFALMDSRVDGETANYLKRNLARTLKEQLEKYYLTNWGILNALNSTFTTLDKKFKKKGYSSFCLAFIIDGNLWIANGGEFKAILMQNNKPSLISLSKSFAQKKTRKSAKKRNVSLIWEKKRWVTEEKVADASMIGGYDIFDRKTLTARPNITCIPLKDLQKDSFLTIINKGMSMAASSKQIATGISRYLKEKISLKDSCRKLVGAAYNANAQENLGVMILPL